MMTAHCGSMSGWHRLDSQLQSVSVNFLMATNTFPTGSHRAKQSPSHSLSEVGHFKFVCLYFSWPFSLSFSHRWDFQGCNTAWKSNLQAQYSGNTDSPQITAYLDNEISPAPWSVSIWTAERGRDLQA